MRNCFPSFLFPDRSIDFNPSRSSSTLICLSFFAALPNISPNARWTQNGVTIAGGHRGSNALNQLNLPAGLYVDDDQTVYITDWGKERIVEWKYGATSGRVVAGGNGRGNRTDQLNAPSDVIVDKEADSLIICDNGNRRMMRWSRRS